MIQLLLCRQNYGDRGLPGIEKAGNRLDYLWKSRLNVRGEMPETLENRREK
jgi:hypothetical protein